MAISQFGKKCPLAFSASRTSRLIFDFLALRTICNTNNKQVSGRPAIHIYYIIPAVRKKAGLYLFKFLTVDES